MSPKPGFSYDFFLYSTLNVKCSICELLVLNPDLDPLVIAFRIWVTSISTDESPNMERSAMLKNPAIHCKTFGLVLGFPILLRRISFPKKNEKTWIPNQVFHMIFFFYSTLNVKCSICELLVLNPDLDPLVIAFRIWVTSISTDESPNMERSAMLKNHAIHGKTFGLVLGFPILLGRISFPQKNEKTWIPNQVFHMIFFFIKLFM